MGRAVDERVVEMRFDNQQFERGIQTSRKSLDALKQSLKLDGAAKGLDDINKAVKGVSLDSIAASVASLQKRFSTFGIVGMRAIQNLTDSTMRFAKNAVGFVTDGIVNGGKRRAMNIENAHFQLQGLLKDEAKVQAVMDDAMDSVDGTAYGFDEAAKAASQFAASGIQAGEQMQSSLRAITGVAAMTNSEYEYISQIFTTVAGNGRLMGDQLLQLSSSGMNAASTLADYMTKVGEGAKVTESQVREMVSKGEVSFELFAAAMDDAFGEHAKKANETFTGAMSNVRASLARIGAEFYSPLIVQNGSLVKFFNALRERINDVKANVGPLAELFTDSVSGMANAATKYLEKLDLAKPFEAFYNIVDVFKNVWRGISSVLRPIRWAFADIFPQSMTDGLVNFSTKLKELTSGLRLSHVDTVNLRKTFKGLFAVLDIVRTVIGGVVQAIFPATNAFGGFGSGILSVTGQIGELLTALDEALKANATFGEAVQKVGDAVGVAFQTIGDFVKKAADTFREFSKNNFSAAAESRLSPFQKICETAKAAMDKLSTAFQEAAPVLSKLGGMIADTMGTIGEGLRKAIHGEGFDSLIDLLNGGLMVGVGSGIMKFIQQLQGAVSDAGGAFGGLKGMLSDVKGVFVSYQKSINADVLMKIAEAIAILAGSLFVLALIDSKKLTGALTAISILFAELAGFMVGFSKTLGGKGMKGLFVAGTMMVKLSEAVLILSVALKVIAGIDSDKLAGTLMGITVLIGELVAASLILSKWGGKVKASAMGMVWFASAIYILAKAVKQMAEIDSDAMCQGLLGVGVLLAELAAFLLVAQFGKLKASQGLALIALASALLILQKAVFVFGQMDAESMAKGLLGVAGSLLAISSAALIMPKNMVGIGLGLLEVAAALTVISGIVQGTGDMEWENIGKGMTVLGGSMAILAAALRVMRGTLSGAAAMLVMSAALAVFTPCLKALGGMSLSEIGKAILALAAAFTVLGIAGAVLGPMIPTILGLAGAFALFGVAVAACGAGVLMLSVGLASLAVSGVAGMTALVACLEILFVGILNVIANSVESIANAVKAVVLSVVDVVVACAPAIAEGALTLIEAVLQSLSEHGPNIVSYLMDFLIGIMNALAAKLPELIAAAVTLIGAFFCGVVEALQSVDTTALMEGIAGIGLLSGLMFALSAVVGLIPSAMVGVVGMGAVIAEMALVLAAIGALAQIPGLEWLIGEGGNLLQGIGAAIGKFVGGIVGGLMSGISAALPQIGLDLSQFMVNATPFFMGLGMITGDALTKAGVLAGIVMLFGAADLIAGITSFLTGGSSLPKMGENLSQFLLSATPFFTGLMLLNESTLDAAKSLAEMILLFTAAEIIQGVASWLTGGSSLSDFGEELVAFGPSIAEFAKTVKGVKAEAVDGAAAAASIMSEVAEHLPGHDGLKQKIFGDKSLAEFGAELVAFGPAIAIFAEIVKDVKAEAVNGAAAAASIMSELATNLPETGGLAAVIFGDNTLSQFGAELVAFGPQIKKFADKVADVDPEAATGAASVAQIMSSLANGLPETDGLKQFFTGEKNLGTFGESLKVFGVCIADFYESIKDIDKPNLIISIANAAKTLGDASKSLSESGSYDFEKFGKGLAAFGEYLSKYYTSVANINTVTLGNVTAEVKKLAKLTVSSTLTAFTDGVKGKQPALTKTFSGLAASALKVFQNKRGKFAVEGKELVEKLASGVKKGKNGLQSAWSALLKDAVGEIQKKRKDFYSAGSYLVDGFVLGIDDNAYKAAAQTKVMAENAVTAARAALDEHSPSKVFAEIGAYVVDGFVNGIDKNRFKAAEAAGGLAQVGVEAAKAVAASLRDGDSVFAEFVEKTDENGEAVEVTLEQAAEAFRSFRDSVKDSVKGATGLFDAFEKEAGVAGKELIQNLKSQIAGISEWAESIQILAAKGIDKGLLKALSDMGPSGAKYVNALVTMSKKQLKKLNKLYEERLSLNDKAADGIAASFLDGGKKAAKSFAKGLKGSDKAALSEAHSFGDAFMGRLMDGSVLAAQGLRGKLKESVGFAFQDAVKEMKKSLDYGKGAFQQFVNAYLSTTKNVTLGTKAIKAASKAITAYGKKLYEESEYYEEDTANVKAHKKSLKDLQNERKKLQKQLKKAQKSNKKASKERAKTLKEELAANNKSIAAAKKQILEDEKEIAEHTKEVFGSMRATLSESVASFLDPLKAGLESGIDLFKKFETNEDLYEADKKNLEEHQESLRKLEETQKSIQDEINAYADKNTLAARLRVKDLKSQLSEVEKSIEDTKSSIEQIEQDMEAHSEVTIDKILGNMQSQVDGVRKWQQNLQTLAGRGISQGLLDKLKDMGVDGADYVSQFLKMTSEELDQANRLFAESESLASQTLLNNFKDTMGAAKNWAAGLQKMAEMGFGQEILEKLGNMGVDGYDYVNAFLSMTPEQVAQFNKEFAESLKLPDTVADQVISSYAYAGGQSVKGFTDALAKMAESGTEENAALADAAGGFCLEFQRIVKAGSRTAGEAAVGSMVKGMAAKERVAMNGSASLGKSALDGMKSKLSAKSGKKVAKNVVNGLNDGLLNGSSKVSETARQVAMMAYESAKKALAIHSPSKKFAELGEYTDAGFVEGLTSGERGIYRKATDVMSRAIQEMSDIINSDLDTEPTIRPVMDLTEIQNGVGSIGRLIDGCAVSGSNDLARAAARGMAGYCGWRESAALDAIKRLQDTMSGLLDRPGIEQHNTFSITGNDPREIANEVSHILQQQVERRGAAWA